MTTVQTNLSTPIVVRTPARSKFFGKNIWAIGDQVLISGSNFVTMVLVARALGAEAFGLFTLVYSVLLLSNIVQSTLVTVPHNVLGSNREGAAFGRFTFSMGLAQAGLVSAEALLIAAAAAVAFARGAAVLRIVPWLFSMVDL